MLGALINLLNSEKAVASGALVICATVLVALGQMTVVDWQDFTKWVLGIYVAGKTVQGTADTITKNRTAPAPTPETK